MTDASSQRGARTTPTAVALDVDTGIDDALAILYAVAHPALQVAVVTGVSGNVELAQVMTNTCQVLAAAGADATPVAAGASVTLAGGGSRAHAHNHGTNGLGDIVLPDPVRSLEPGGAVQLLRRQLVTAPEPLIAAALAPQTNLATLVREYPDVTEHIERIVFVGGRITELNPPGVAEFNVGHDPEAAAAVLHAGIPLTMYGLDVFEQVVVPESTARRLAGHVHPAIRLAGQLLLVRRGHLIGDAGALVLLTNPELFAVEPLRIAVALTGDERGRTLVDASRSDPSATSVDVVTAVNAAQAAQAFISVINGYAA
jgi:pyrimidine-specific ribonucleoside hydrolase